MPSAGGLKLALRAADRDDRRARFAEVTIAPVPGGEEITLVTDGRGRMRFRLSPGHYRLRVEDGGETDFVVRGAGWTPVRLRLT